MEDINKKDIDMLMNSIKKFEYLLEDHYLGSATPSDDAQKEFAVVEKSVQTIKKSLKKIYHLVKSANNEEIIKKALYHIEKGNLHRITKKEADEGIYYCPRCRSGLHHRKGKFNSVYVCLNDGCNFTIREDQLTDGFQKQIEII